MLFIFVTEEWEIEMTLHFRPFFASKKNVLQNTYERFFRFGNIMPEPRPDKNKCEGYLIMRALLDSVLLHYKEKITFFNIALDT